MFNLPVVRGVRWLVFAIFPLGALTLLGFSPDPSKPFTLEITITSSSDYNGKQGRNVGQVYHETYRPDGTFSGLVKGRYTYTQAGPYGASITQSVQLSPNKFATRIIQLTIPDDATGAGMIYSQDPAFGIEQGVATFSCKFLAEDNTPAKAGPTPMFLAAAFAKPVSNVEAGARDAAAKLVLPGEVRNRMDSFDPSRSYWALTEERRVKVGGEVPLDPANDSSEDLSSDHSEAGRIARARELLRTSANDNRPSKMVPWDVTAIPGARLHFQVLRYYLRTLGRLDQARQTDAQAQALALFSGDGIYAPWLEQQAKGAEATIDELSLTQVDRVRALVRGSAEVAGADDNTRETEREQLRKALANHDNLASPPLTNVQLTALEARLADAVHTKSATGSVTLDPDETVARSSQPKAGTRVKLADLDLSLVAVPPGSFRMGEGGYRPGQHVVVHPVTISQAFWMGATEVTVQQYQLLGMTLSASVQSFNAKPQFPVRGVSWYQAVQWCQALTDRERVAGRLPEGYVYALPSEAQWEYACGAGKNEDDIQTVVHNRGEPSRAGVTKPNSWGLFDMKGNVWEWTYDYMNPASAPLTELVDPIGEGGNDAAVCGGYYGNPNNGRPTWSNADQNSQGKHTESIEVGFRVVLRHLFPRETPVAAPKPADPAIPRLKTSAAANNAPPDSARPFNPPVGSLAPKPVYSSPAAAQPARVSGELGSHFHLPGIDAQSFGQFFEILDSEKETKELLGPRVEKSNEYIAALMGKGSNPLYESKIPFLGNPHTYLFQKFVVNPNARQNPSANPWVLIAYLRMKNQNEVSGAYLDLKNKAKKEFAGNGWSMDEDKIDPDVPSAYRRVRFDGGEYGVLFITTSRPDGQIFRESTYSKYYIEIKWFKTPTLP